MTSRSKEEYRYNGDSRQNISVKCTTITLLLRLGEICFVMSIVPIDSTWKRRFIIASIEIDRNWFPWITARWCGPRREIRLNAKERFICDRPRAAECRAAGWSGREAGCLWSAIWRAGPDRAARQEDRARRKSARPSLPATRKSNLFQRFPQNFGFCNSTYTDQSIFEKHSEVCEKVTHDTSRYWNREFQIRMSNL